MQTVSTTNRDAPGSTAPMREAGPAALTVENGALTLADSRGFILHQYPDGQDTWIRSGAAATLLRDDALLALVLTVAPVTEGATAADLRP
jgi:hypothetical protein